MTEFVNRRAMMKWAAALPLFGIDRRRALWQNSGRGNRNRPGQTSTRASACGPSSMLAEPGLI